MDQSPKIAHIWVKSDSKVVIGQVTGTFEAKGENMQKYLACIQQLAYMRAKMLLLELNGT